MRPSIRWVFGLISLLAALLTPIKPFLGQLFSGHYEPSLLGKSYFEYYPLVLAILISCIVIFLLRYFQMRRMQYSVMKAFERYVDVIANASSSQDIEFRIRNHAEQKAADRLVRRYKRKPY